MATSQTLLCIHREPAQLRVLQDKGYELLTASNGCEGLRLFMSRPVDAIVLEYHLGLLDGALVADEIKQIRPEIPIIMLAGNLELPEGALKSVDALVTLGDGAHFLWATVHFVLNVMPGRDCEEKATMRTSRRRTGREGLRDVRNHALSNLAGRGTEQKYAPFSPAEWKAIRDGTFSF